jgi:hypothetical protein
MIEYSHVESLLKFLDIPRKHWHVAIEKIALVSVQAFNFLHRVLFGGPIDESSLTWTQTAFAIPVKTTLALQPRGSTKPPTRASVELTQTLTRMNMSDFTKKLGYCGDPNTLLLQTQS